MNLDMSFQLVDFFTYYEYTNQPSTIYPEIGNIDDSLIAKQEFSNDKWEGYLPHQTLVAKWMSPNTLYDKLLVFHAVGTGKACLMGAVGELAKFQSIQLPKIIILTSETLRNNLLDEFAFGTCMSGKYEEKNPTLTSESRKSSSYRNVRKSYQIKTVTDFLNTIRDIPLPILRQEYNGCYLFIDEAHNLVPSGTISKEISEKYSEVKSFIEKVPGVKLMLLTATPMRNSSKEIIPLLNLILPLEKQISTDTFFRTWFKEDKFINSNDFIRRYLQNNVSYLRAISPDSREPLYADKIALKINNIKDNEDINDQVLQYIENNTLQMEQKTPVRIVNCGTIYSPLLKYTRTVQLEMDSYQTASYKTYFSQDQAKLKHEENEEEEETIGLALKSRQASSFIFPPTKTNQKGQSGKEGEKNFLNLEYYRDSSNIKNYHPSDALVSYINMEGTSPRQHLSQIKKCSAKFAYSIEKILQFPDQKMFVFSSIVNGGGCILFASLLKLMGYEEVSATVSIENLQPKPRFTFLTNKSSSEIDNLVNKVFNHERNLYGQYVQVIIGSEVITEGLSFKQVRKMFLLTPTWNMAVSDQAIGRVVRSFGHDALPPEKRIVGIYRLCAIPSDDTNSIDALIYNRAEKKDITIKQVERVLKQSAWDCYQNQSKNKSKFDGPNTRECDYQQCEYECDAYTNEQKVKSISITDTYNLIYGDTIADELIHVIQGIFSVEYSLPFEVLLFRIKESYQEKINSILLARTLYKMITEHIEIRNSYGLINYLREDRNLYFLTDDPTSSSIYTMAYYAAHPTYSFTYSPKEALTLYYEKQMPLITNVLLKHATKTDVIKRILLENIPKWLAEHFVESVFTLSTNTDLARTIRKIFETGFFTINNQIAHNFFGRWRILAPEGWREATEEEQKANKTSKDERFLVNKELAFVLGYEANIPSLYDEKKPFLDLHIKTHFRAKKTQTGKLDSRYDREGLTCGTSNLSKFGLVKFIFELCLLALENKLDIPLLSYKPTKKDGSKINLNDLTPLDQHKEYEKKVKEQLGQWTKIVMIGEKVQTFQNSFSILEPLRHELKKTDKQTYCNILGIGNLEECNRNESAEQEESIVLNKKDIISAIQFLSKDTIQALFERVWNRPYEEKDLNRLLNTVVKSKEGVNIRDILTKAINSPNKDELCEQIGLWFQKNKLLGFFEKEKKKKE